MEAGLFVEPSEELRWLGPSTNGVSLKDLAEVPCLVLLGDVGMGKTTAIQTEAADLKSELAGQKHAVLCQDLKRLSEAQLERSVFGSSEVQGWLRGEHALTLFLDSMDECWRRIDALEVLIVEGFERRAPKGCPPLFLRLTCRSAEWRGEAGKMLERLFSKGGAVASAQVFVLAPLSANNVRQAAASNNLDGNHLLQRIAAKEAQALASHPITLEMLLQVYRRSGDFPRSRAELYSDGCSRLCADQQMIFGAPQQRKTTPQQRVVIASRLAALSVFTNRLLINGDMERPVSRADVLEGTEVVGYFEEPVGGECVVVDRDSTAETLQTALFADRVEGAQCWRHQSYAEYLAAHYLAQRKLSVSQVVALLTDTADNAQRIIPQLEETACWMAEIIPEVLEALAPRNADVLLRCDSTYWNDYHRALLVGSYLELVRRQEAQQLDWQLKYRFARLAHRELAALLRPVITDRAENPLVRETAIDIAGQCGVFVLAPELIDVLLDSNDVFRVRKHAGIALEHSATDGTRSLLKAKNVRTWEGDVDDDLKGYYLGIMWPSHISIDELLPLTKPKRRNYTGSYKLFLEYELPKSLTDADLPRLLDWFREHNVSFDILGEFGYLPSKVFARALTCMDNPCVRDAVLRLLSAEETHLHRLFQGNVRRGETSADIRLPFWKALVRSHLDVRKVIIHGDLGSTGLLSSEDLKAFVAEYRSVEDSRIRDGWRELIFWVFSFEDATALDLLSHLARTDASIADGLAARTSCALLPEEQNWIKQAYERAQKSNRPIPAEKPSFAKSVLGLLDHFERGNVAAYWYICDLLDQDPDEPKPIVFLSIRFSEGKAWRSLSAEAKARILRGFFTYLRTQAVEETAVWNKSQGYRQYDLLNPFLVLLYDEDRCALDELTSDDWSKWISVFFSYFARRNGSHEEAYSAILSRAYGKAQQVFLAVLGRHLETQINNDSERPIIWNLKAVWCGEIRRLLLDLLDRKWLKPTATQDVFQVLASLEPKQTELILTAIARGTDDPQACSVHVPVALATLLVNFPATWASHVLDRIKVNPALGRALVPCLVRAYHQPSGWLSEIPPRQLAEFWEWLNKHFPENPFETEDGVGEVTVHHDIYHLRNAVFETLRRSASPEACDAMSELMKRWPNEFWLGDVLAEMRKTRHRRAWVRPSPSALMQSFATTNKRLVRTGGELHGLILESLRRFEAELHGAPPSMELWNETTKGKEKFWWPKNEMNLSTCLKRFFERDLKEWGVIADREVEIHPRLGADRAQLVDVLVRAVPFAEDGRRGAPVTVVVEVKCAWNPGVLLDMERQLYGRYLNNSELHFGIYAVAYFTCDAWNSAGDDRKTTGESPSSVAALRDALLTQATSLSGSQKLVESVIIDARLSLT
jgi:hypothetical protein